MAETKAAQAACEALRRELAGHATTYTKLAELVKSLEGVQNQVKRIAGDFVSNMSQLDGLSASLKEASTVLQSLSLKS
jgi:hypothetical protein